MLENADHSLGLFVRQRAQKNVIYNGEHGGRSGNTKGERSNNSGGEARRSAHLPKSVFEIKLKPFEPEPSVRFAGDVLDQGNVPKLALRLLFRARCISSALAPVCGGKSEMRGDLFVEFGLRSSGRKNFGKRMRCSCEFSFLSVA